MPWLYISISWKKEIQQVLRKDATTSHCQKNFARTTNNKIQYLLKAITVKSGGFCIQQEVNILTVKLLNIYNIKECKILKFDHCRVRRPRRTVFGTSKGGRSLRSHLILLSYSPTKLLFRNILNPNKNNILSFYIFEIIMWTNLDLSG